MYKILLVSHGTIAKGFYDSMPMILGTQEDVSYICLNENSSVEYLQEQVENQILNVWKDHEVLVLADMMNGTPSRIAAQVLSQHACDGEVICGMNLHLLLEAYIRRAQSIKEVAESILDAGRPSFIKMNISLDEDNE